MNRARRNLLAIVAGAFFFLPPVLPVPPIQPAHAQSRRPMSLLDIAELSRTIDPQISPDGRFVTYGLSHADWKANRPIFQMWRQEIGRGSPVQLTFAE